MEKRNKYIIRIIALTLIIAFSSTAIAYMFKQTSYKENNFITAAVSCEVIESTNDTITEKTEIKVNNTSNIPVYIRVRLVSYWTDNTGIIARPSPEIIFSNSIDWIKGDNDIYYYKKPVKPGYITSNLLSDGYIIELQEDDEGNKQIIEVFAEAIQSTPQKAVINSWNTSVDGNGNIVSVN